MTKRVYRRSLTSVFMGLIVFIIAFFVGLAEWSHGKTAMGCMALMSAFGLVFMVFYGLMSNKPRVVIDEEGICAQDWGAIKILWTDIHNVKIISLPKLGSSITLELADKNKYMHRLSEDERFARKMSKWFNDAEFSFISNSLDAPTVKIYEEIKHHIDRTSHLRDAANISPSEL